MNISVQAASFNAADLAQSQGGNTFASARVATVTGAVSASANTQIADSTRTKSELQQQTTNRSAPQASVNTQPDRAAHTSFEYNEQVRIMKVVDKRDVLIYQVPAKGALEIIKAEAETRALEATA